MVGVLLAREPPKLSRSSTARNPLAKLGQLLVRPLLVGAHHFIEEDVSFFERERLEQVVETLVEHGREDDDVAPSTPSTDARTDVVSARRVVPHATP